ncbi:MAG: hypothetical protein Q8900_10420 [Bacillota bacterium]|nr:hypothetical protein [Bacillota bacterium]
MASIIKNYSKMIKSGFFNKPLLNPLILTLILFFFHDINFIFLLMFLMISGVLIPMYPLNEISENKYILFSTLPIKTRDFIKLMYFQNYVIYLLCFIFTLILGIVFHDKTIMKCLIIILINLVLSNVFFPFLASTELKLGINQQEKCILWMVLNFLIMCLIAAAYLLIQIKINFQINLMLILTSFIIAASTIKKSFSITVSKIMG